ncbi:MAG: hypothetical protein OD817_01090, partial [Gammaproteobacteria bacterium]
MRIRSLTFCLALLLSLGAQAQSSLAGLAPTESPAMQPAQSATIKLISYLIEKSHYRTRPLDDEFSDGML